MSGAERGMEGPQIRLEEEGVENTDVSGHGKDHYYLLILS